MAATCFEYLYRDASNFKAFGRIILNRSLSTDEDGHLRSKLFGGEYFIAEQVGIPTLYEQLYQWSDGPTPSDHCWHEFVGFTSTDVAASQSTVFWDAANLVSKFMAVSS